MTRPQQTWNDEKLGQLTQKMGNALREEDEEMIAMAAATLAGFIINTVSTEEDKQSDIETIIKIFQRFATSTELKAELAKHLSKRRNNQ
jgi:hypothetical protein